MRYWLQMFLNKLMDVVTMEQLVHIKELALECFLQVLYRHHVILCDHT